MTIIYSESIAPTVVFRGILINAGFADAPQTFFTTVNSLIRPQALVNVTVYSGAQPSAATIISNWTSYNTSFLFHQPSVYLEQEIYDGVSSASKLTRATAPTAVTAANNGTAAWAIIWINGGTAIAAGTGTGQISNATIPSTSFIVCPVTTVADGSGFVLLTSTSITSGNSVTVDDFNIRFTF